MATTPATPWYLDHGFWSAVLTLVLALYAVLVPGLAGFGIHLPALPGGILDTAIAVLGSLGIHAAFTVNTSASQ